MKPAAQRPEHLRGRGPSHPDDKLITGHIRILALASALGLGLVAEAHAHLKSSTPAMGATIATSPSELVLSFSEGENAKFTGVKVEGLDHAAVATGDAKLGPAGDKGHHRQAVVTSAPPNRRLVLRSSLSWRRRSRI